MPGFVVYKKIDCVDRLVDGAAGILKPEIVVVDAIESGRRNTLFDDKHHRTGGLRFMVNAQAFLDGLLSSVLSNYDFRVSKYTEYAKSLISS